MAVELVAHVTVAHCPIKTSSLVQNLPCGVIRFTLFVNFVSSSLGEPGAVVLSYIKLLSLSIIAAVGNKRPHPDIRSVNQELPCVSKRHNPLARLKSHNRQWHPTDYMSLQYPRTLFFAPNEIADNLGLSCCLIKAERMPSP